MQKHRKKHAFVHDALHAKLHQIILKLLKFQTHWRFQVKKNTRGSKTSTNFLCFHTNYDYEADYNVINLLCSSPGKSHNTPQKSSKYKDAKMAKKLMFAFVTTDRWLNV